MVLPLNNCKSSVKITKLRLFTNDLQLFRGRTILLLAHFTLHLSFLHLLKPKNEIPLSPKEKLPPKWSGMLILSRSDLRQAHPASLPQQVLRRLPANGIGLE